MASCENCMNFEYDEEFEEYMCSKELDEDEMYRLMEGGVKECPFFRAGDEYQIVKHQM